MKGRSKSKNSKRKYAKPISLYPLKPEEVLSAFMKVDPKKIKKPEKKISPFYGAGMDKVHKKHMIKIMKTFKKEDYEKMDKDLLEMMGELTEEDKNFIREIRRKLKK